MIYVYQNKKGCPFSEWYQLIKERELAVYRKVNAMLEQMQSDTLPLVRPNVKKKHNEQAVIIYIKFV